MEIRYPADLPITERREEILEALSTSKVVIVAGETGSGKSTQLPKFCLELGRGDVAESGRRIGHTQPRRIAARSVAERVAEELGEGVGGVVGYAVRFTDRVGPGTRVKVMTDGILLAEIQRDRNLNRYDTLIVDEAHERSLNIDFILGYLKQLLPRRPDLKIVITSATIDTERFSRHFDDAPVVEVSGRTYPVDIRYHPVDEDGDDPIVAAVEELAREGPGDVLVFLSGEREIRDAADALVARRLPDTEILPLYARLSAAEQHRVFAPHPGRRIVLSTNVAETSLTVPGVRYVVDTGTARISRFNRRTKVQRLPIEAISQASANQRAGRCGRLGPGVCIRLYAEDDFLARPEFTDPEILRTNLASVILQMAAIGLGDVAAFPFVDPPDARAIKDGVTLLEELGALRDGRLTKLGRRLAQLPLDPRIGRMVLAAAENGCVREVIAIAAALSIQDPRERPLDARQEADEKHARFTDPDSDFVALLNLWEYLRERQKALSSSQFRKLCKADHLNYLRVREWQDLFSQLRQIAGGMGLHVAGASADGAVPRDAIHRSLLTGLVSHVGLKDAERQEYLGARNARFALSPASALFKRSPKWVMAAELVETNRLWARVAARVRPDWIEAAAAHLVKRTYSDPWWDAGRAAAVANESVSLYGIPLVSARKVAFARIDREWARELFIRHALVEGDWPRGAHHRFVADNAALIEEVRAMEDRWRRRDLLVGDDELYAFFDARVPADVVSGGHFDGWWKQASRANPELLHFSLEDVLAADVDDPASAFPDAWVQGPLSLPLSYVFDPGSDDDGVVVHVPLAVLNRVSPGGFDWHVPGLRLELVTALLRSLPKAVRRHFVPAPEYAAGFLAKVGPGDGPLVEQLQRYLTQETGVAIPRGAWDVVGLPPHLRLRFVVEDESGDVVASGGDLAVLQDQLRPDMREALSTVADVAGAAGSTTWTFGTLAPVVEEGSLRAYPALVDQGTSVAVAMFESPAAQARAMAAGTRRLLLLTLPPPAPVLQRLLDNKTKLAIASSPYPSAAALVDDAVDAAVDHLVALHGGPAWDEASFAVLRGAVGGDVVDVALDAVRRAGGLLAARRATDSRLDRLAGPGMPAAAADVRSQLGRLFDRSFVSTMGVARLPDVARYLLAIERRLDKLPAEAARDAQRMATVQRLEDAYDDLVATAPLSGPEPELVEVRWMIEELRVSLFAQALGTPYRVSEERIRKALAAIGG